MSEITNLEGLLKHELEDLYSAEQQIIEALPVMIERAQDRLLKKSLKDHLAITRKQKTRLDKIKKMLGAEKKEEMGLFKRLFMGDGEKKCLAMEGLISEGNKMMGEEMEPEVMDAAIIAAAQKIEHYEISGYGTAKAYALQLGLRKVVTLIEETLNEEYDADDLLTELAVGKVNLEADGQEVKGLKKIPAKRDSAKSNIDRGRTPRNSGTRKRRPTTTGSGKSKRR
jgi:ferritin-like metal-binding protein YciE